MTQIGDNKFWRNKKVLVTGHSGFKGSWLVYWLNMMGAEICGLSLEDKNLLWDNLEINLGEFDIRADIRLDNWQSKVRHFNPEIIFHLAAQPLVVTGWEDPLLTFSTNVYGTAKLLNEIKYLNALKVVLVVTSDKVYKLDGSNTLRNENSELGGADPYSASKAAAELLVHSWPKQSEVVPVTARSGNVIGGGDWSKDRLIPDILSAGKENRTLLVRNPNSVRPWQHVVEPIAGYLIMAKAIYESKLDIKTLNFGPSIDNQVTVSDVIKYSLPYLPFNRVLKYSTLNEKLYQESELLFLDSKLAEAKLHWKQVLDWKLALKMTYKWYEGFENGISPRKLIEHDIDAYLQRKN